MPLVGFFTASAFANPSTVKDPERRARSAIYGTRYIINGHFLHAAASRLHIPHKSINFATMRVPPHIIYALRVSVRSFSRFMARSRLDLVLNGDFTFYDEFG